MTLVLPVTSLVDINLAELQLNSPTCPVTYNSTHLTAHISLNGCGTTAVHSGSELVYTNTLKSVRPYTMISRKPSLVLPLACRIPGVQAKGSQYAISMPTEREIFGEIRVWIEFYLPGEGPLARFTATPRFRSNFVSLERARRQAEVGTANNTVSTSNSSSLGIMAIGSRLKQLDLHVMSNCSVSKAEMIVSSCVESETEDFAKSVPILEKGCISSNSTLEVVTTTTTSKIYRLNLDAIGINGTKMYVECKLNLCIATKPSDKCPDLCNPTNSSSPLVGSVFTSSYTVRSTAVSLLVTTAAPTVTLISTTPNTATTLTAETKSPTSASNITPPGLDTSKTTAATSTSNVTSSSRAPETSTSLTAAVILTAIHVFLQMKLLH